MLEERFKLRLATAQVIGARLKLTKTKMYHQYELYKSRLVHGMKKEPG